MDGEEFDLDHGRVVIAAITSCTNTSNPSVMVGAGLLARNALARGLDTQALGEDLARARLDGRHRLPRGRRASTRRSTGSASTSSATAARPASATPARCRRRSRPRSRTRTSSSARCSPATATSRAGSTRTSRPTTWPRRRSASPTRSPAGWTSTSRREPLGRRRRRRAGLPARHLALAGGGQGDRRRGGAGRDVHARATPTSSPGDEAWQAIEVPEGDRYTWPESTYVRRPLVLRGHGRSSPRTRSRSRAPGCWPSSASRSPPTTSPRRERSRRRARQVSG